MVLKAQSKTIGFIAPDEIATLRRRLRRQVEGSQALLDGFETYLAHRALLDRVHGKLHRRGAMVSKKPLKLGNVIYLPPPSRWSAGRRKQTAQLLSFQRTPQSR